MNERERNRREFPESAKVIDEFRRVFGSIPWFELTENGKMIRLGKRCREFRDLDQSPISQASDCRSQPGAIDVDPKT